MHDMQTMPLTRRTFVAGCIGTGVALAVSSAQTTHAFAEGGDIGPGARPKSAQVHTICQGCPNACGYTTYTVEGKLGKVIGDASNPNSAGNLCALGYGFTQSVYSESNLPNPLRRKDNGEFKTISWDEAFSEIAERLNNIIAQNGAGSVAAICNGAVPTIVPYMKQFMETLGSANTYVDDVTQNLNKQAAFAQVIGVGSYTPDFTNSDLIVLIDSSCADIAAPDKAAALQSAREAGTSIVSLDPRLGTMGMFAGEWLAVNPGSELALLLAVCNVLIQNGRYDTSLIASESVGFDAWAEAINPYTPQWAESLTGVQSYQIEDLAARIADAAPHVAIEYCNGDIGASTYENSSATARVVCLLNTLLGSWNVAGGALLPFDYPDVSLASVMPEMAPSMTVLATAQPDADFPLGEPFGASAGYAMYQARTGQIKALFSIDSDIIYEYEDPEDSSQALKGLDLFVCITQQMTSTAARADYVLPLRPYLECASLPLFLEGNAPGAVIANAVVEAPSSSNALPVEDIVSGLALACGLEEAFSFSLDEVASLQLKALNLSLEALQENGSTQFSTGANAIPRIANWRTPTGKIQFLSTACAAAGLSALPLWSPLSEPSSIIGVISDDMNMGQTNKTKIVVQNEMPLTFNLMTGPQAVIGYQGANVAELMDIAEQYDLESVWVNASVAEDLGISTGDTVMIYNDNATCRAKAFVTQRIAPTALYLPSFFGHTAEGQRTSFEKGINPTSFGIPTVEQGYGTLCTQGACVQLAKEGE